MRFKFSGYQKKAVLGIFDKVRQPARKRNQHHLGAPLPEALHHTSATFQQTRAALLLPHVDTSLNGETGARLASVAIYWTGLHCVYMDPCAACISAAWTDCTLTRSSSSIGVVQHNWGFQPDDLISEWGWSWWPVRVGCVWVFVCLFLYYTVYVRAPTLVLIIHKSAAFLILTGAALQWRS